MMRSKIRTVGFALLGGGRASDTPSDAQIAAAQQGLRSAAGGWGAPDSKEAPDAEVAELIASDLGRTPGGGEPGKLGGYHRVSEGNVPGSAEDSSFADTNDALATGEGYYELCVRSVEAVKYDPELD